MAGIAIVAVAVARSPAPPPQPPAAEATAPLPAVVTAPAATTGTIMPRSEPVTLSIPAIGLNTAVVPVTVGENQIIQTPTDPHAAGWYRYSPTPGQQGPAVIVGHVDAAGIGPAVFYRLGAIKTGDAIHIVRKDHTLASFVVDAIRAYPKTAFPTAAVYADTAQATLRLITCSGWNAATHAYRDNTIVFAHLADFDTAGHARPR